jgi:hypothetical protein
LLLLKEDDRISLITSYLDDTYTIVKPQHLEGVYWKLKELSANQCGLQIKEAKSYALFKHWDKAEHEAIAILLETVLHIEPKIEGAVAIGAPIGSNRFRSNFIKNIAIENLQKIEKITSACRTSQEQWVMFYYTCKSTFQHTLRTAPKEIAQDGIKIFDKGLQEMVTKIAKIRPEELTNSSRECINLPCREGGLGITTMETTAHAAFLAAHVALRKQQVHERTGRKDFEDLYEENLVDSEPNAEDPFYYLKVAATELHKEINLQQTISKQMKSDRNSQRIEQQDIVVSLTNLANAKVTQSVIMAAIQKQQAQKLFAKLNQLARQDLLSQSQLNHYQHLVNSQGCEPSLARNAIPYNKQLVIPDIAMQSSIRETLGVSLIYASATGFCEHPNCKQQDRGGRHQASCKSGHVAKIRHKMLLDIIGAFANEAGVGPTVYEPRLYVDKEAGSQGNHLRCDHLWPCFEDDQTPVYTDVSVTDTTAPTKQAAVPEAGHKARLKYNDKVDRYKNICTNNGGKFFPIIFESAGYWHPKTKELMEKLAVKTAIKIDGNNENEILIAAILNHWATKISVTILKTTYYYAASSANVNKIGTYNYHDY